MLPEALENGKSMCLTGRLPFSNYCISSLATGFRFLHSMCIPLAQNFNIGCCANENLLRLIAPARSIFHVYVCINIGLGIVSPFLRLPRDCI